MSAQKSSFGKKIRKWHQHYLKTNAADKNIWLRKFLKDNGLARYTEPLILIKEWTTTIIYALLLAAVFKTFFYENFKIPSGSMNPLLLNGDRVLVNKWYYGYSKFSFPLRLVPIDERVFVKNMPQRGDVIVFLTKFSEANGIYYIKRVIGLPNDRIKVVNNQVYINGIRLRYQQKELLPKNSTYNHNNFPSMEYIEDNGVRQYSVLISDINSIAGNTKEYIVPEGHYFCMGDNRDNSHDSRFPDFSTVPFRNIVGKAEKVFFSTANGGLNINRFWGDIYR